MDLDPLQQTLRDQDGVISRRQLRELDVKPHDVRRMLRRRELVTLHPGVYLDHTGEPTWIQRAQAAVLVHWPAALTGRSALPRPPTDGPIQVAVDARRTVTPVRGVHATRVAGLGDRVAWNRSPPRVRLEHVALELAAQASDEAAAFAVLSDACQSRETSPALLKRALESRRRLRSGRVVRALVADLVAGSCSVLERGYLHHVQRPHGLPRGELQAEGSTHGKRAVRDVLLADLGVAIELDGRAFHDTASSRDADHERDLAAAAGSDLLTIRLTYGQVFSTPCRTAGLMHALLVRRGWDGSLGTCDRCAGS